MKGRRALLKLFAGAGLLAGSGVRLKDLGAATAGIDPMAMPDPWNVGANVGVACDPVEAAMARRLGEARRAAYAEIEDRLDFARAPIPAHIDCMRSWSPVYKRAVATAELRRMRNLYRVLDSPVGSIPQFVLDMLEDGDAG